MTRFAHTGFGKWAAVLLVVFALGSCRPLFHRQVSGIVLAVEGTARARANGQIFRLTTDSCLFPGTTIELPANGQVDLMLLPGILVEATGESEIEITQLLLARDGDETIHPMKRREATLRLTRGALCISVGRARTGQASCKIHCLPAAICLAAVPPAFALRRSMKSCVAMKREFVFGL